MQCRRPEVSGPVKNRFSRNFCEMGPSSKDVFDHIVTLCKGLCRRVLTLKGNRDDWHMNRSFFSGKFSKSEPK